jgi:hypothetical protein
MFRTLIASAICLASHCFVVGFEKIAPGQSLPTIPADERDALLAYEILRLHRNYFGFAVWSGAVELTPLDRTRGGFRLGADILPR